MALMVTASPPSRFRPPPDPPPYESPLFEDLSPIAPPEPPDPPDAVYLLVPLQIPNTSAKPSLQEFTQNFVLMLACPTMVTELYGSGAYLVPAGNTPSYVRLFPVIYMSYFRGADWSSLRSYLDLPLQSLHVVLQVQLSLLLSAYFYTVEWVGIQVVWNTLDMWSLVLVNDVLMDRFSFSSILVPLSGIYVDSVRSRTTICSFFIVSSLAFGAAILLFSSWWQLEEKRIGIFHLVNMVLMDIDFSVVSWLEQFIFPKFSLVWSELEAQALLVLKGSFSQLMLFSAFGAEIVILWITLDASIQEVYEIVMQFLWFLVMCVNSISYFISFSLLLTFVALLYPPLVEFELF
ncbi:hypothetical protein Bca4012_057042 [Brassica carinata]